MATDKPTRYPGCWTCRLRHKRCDKSLPVCGNCAGLEISCYSDRRRPEWMDNGVRQREMAQRLKTEVKRGALRRRSKRHIERIAQRLDGELSTSSPQTPPTPLDSSLPLPVNQPTASNSATGLGRDDGPGGSWRHRSPSNSTTAESNTTHARSDSVPDGSRRLSSDYATPLDLTLASQPFGDELELSFVMTYLDYIFPVLFPFYRPTIFEGGRSWLLVLPTKNKALYHTILSLVSYFFSVVPVGSGPEYQACSSVARDEQPKQVDLAVQTVQRDLDNLNRRGVQSNLLESVHLLESIVQLLTLEGIIAMDENWRIHLDAALVLFEQIFQYYGGLSSLLELMRHGPIISSSPNIITPFNADQAAFRFFFMILLVYDIMSSTGFEHPPRLHTHYADLFPDAQKNHDREALFQLDHVIGCQTWAMLLVGEISSLDAWKKDMKKQGTLSMTQLVKRASTIEQDLQNGLDRLDASAAQPPTPSLHRSLDLFTKLQLPAQHPCPWEATNSITCTWAHAARLYLHITLSGWQVACPEIRDDVTRTLELLSGLPSPNWLRQLAWPLCVAGCLATEEQESGFRKVIDSMGPLRELGMMQVALRIMENVWRMRGQIDVDSWDIASCLRDSGFMVLLI